MKSTSSITFKNAEPLAWCSASGLHRSENGGTTPRTSHDSSYRQEIGVHRRQDPYTRPPISCLRGKTRRCLSGSSTQKKECRPYHLERRGIARMYGRSCHQTRSIQRARNRCRYCMVDRHSSAVSMKIFLYGEHLASMRVDNGVRTHEAHTHQLVDGCYGTSSDDVNGARWNERSWEKS